MSTVTLLQHGQHVFKQLATTNALKVTSDIATDAFVYISKRVVFFKQAGRLPPQEEHIYVHTIDHTDITWTVTFSWKDMITLVVKIDNRCALMTVKEGQYARSVDLINPLCDQKLRFYEFTVMQHVYNKIFNVLCNKQLLKPEFLEHLVLF